MDAIDEGIQSLIDDMFETMYDAQGVGLAAPQVGESIRLLVMDISPMVEGAEPLVLINPEITETEGAEEGEEGCLSVPDFRSFVKRASRVVVNALDRDGNPVELREEGFTARALQHEIDHLEGILFVDRLSSLKKDIFRRKHLKKLKAGAVA